MSSTPTENAFEGKTIARCRVGARLGRGRTSHVFKAFYEPLQKDIALKILSGDLANEAEIRANFMKEAQTVARLDHEHIVKVLDVVEDQGCLCILMEYVAGETLQDRLDDGGPLPTRKAARIAAQVANALASAHAEKVLHRDIKPANIILTKGSDQVKVVDFGLAGSSSLANRAGTPMYMSPEACQGKRVDEKTDVYALGVCLYQMLTGELPFGGDSVKAILQAHIGDELTPVSEVNADLGADFDGLLKKLLVKSKGYRPTAEEAAKLLDPFFQDELSGTKPDRRASGRAGGRKSGGGARRGGAARSAATRAPAKKSPVPIIATIGIVVVGIAVAAFALKGNGDEPASVDPNDNTTNTNTGNGQAPPPPPPPKEDPGQVAFAAALDYARDNASDRDGQIKRFKSVEIDHMGTPWAKKAAGRRELIEQEIRDEKSANARKEKQAAELAAAQEKRKALNALCDVFDFAAAAKKASSISAMPDQSFPEWQARQRRLKYLAENLAARFNAGLDGNPVALNRLDPSAPGIREITGCTNEGFQWTDGSLTGVTKWADLKPRKKQIFDLARRLISQSDWAGNIFHAVLAAELWYEEGEAHKDSKEAQMMVELTDDVGGSGEAARRRLFSK